MERSDAQCARSSGHGWCIACSEAIRRGEAVHDLVLAIFALAAGFTASGIMANFYRLLASDTASSLGRAAFVAVMIFAGPNVLFENAAKAWREKSCSAVAFWVAAAISGYWSLAIGLLVIQLGIALKGP
jgi:hypothetical protein